MATVRWTGGAAAVKQVDTLTVGGTIEIGDKFSVTINGKTITTASTTTSTSTTAGEIATAWNASTITEFTEVTALASGSTVVLTADTAGKPFTVTVATTESDDTAADLQTFTKASTTANAGPGDWSTATNWSGGAVPVSSDDVYIENSNAEILYGLSQSAVTLTSLHIAASFTGKIGLPKNNPLGYAEYRTDYLTISSTTVNVGLGEGAGSSRIKLNVGTAATTVNVYKTGNSAENGLNAFIWKGTHASNVLNVQRGLVAVAPFGGETATIATLRIGYITSQLGDSNVVCGAGVTLTTITQSGGTLATNSGATTVTITGGATTLESGNITTLDVFGGTVYYRGTGTITTLNVGNGAEVSFNRDLRARTVTNANLFAGGKILDSEKTVTWTNGVDLEACALPEVTLDLGTNVTITPSAI